MCNTVSLNNFITGVDINVESILNTMVVGSDDIFIAVIDSGLDPYNENFTSSKKFRCNFWNNEEMCCGYNMIKNSCSNLYIKDEYGHGTHVAGIIGGNVYYVA